MARKLVFSLLVVAAFLGLAEAALRVGGLPTGRYAFLFEQQDELYFRNHTEVVSWGPIKYLLQTNDHGLRGPQLAPAKPPGTVRVAALGDSVTDGFFADNPDTYPAVLQDLLIARGAQVEVLNAARAGGSIDKEARILRQLASLDLDVVVLTFVTNDISDIVGKDLAVLRDRKAPVTGSAFERFVLGRTAIGELVFSLHLRSRSSAPEVTRAPVVEGLTDARYAIEGGTAYEDNARDFLARYATTDGLALEEVWSPEVERAVENYLAMLALVQAFCEELGVELVFAFFPSYPELYLPGTSDGLRQRLEAWCDDNGLRWLDITPAYLEHPREEPLHLAPVDYHPNPTGYRVIAETVAAYLLEEGLVDAR